jgi:hypothetical protein
MAEVKAPTQSKFAFLLPREVQSFSLPKGEFFVFDEEVCPLDGRTSCN